MLESRVMNGWQRALLTLCVAGMVQLVVSVPAAHILTGYSGIHAGPSGTAFVDEVGFVDKGSPGARSGLQPGDLIDLRELSRADRFRWRYDFLVGDRTTLPVQRAGRRLNISLDVDRYYASSSPFWSANSWNVYLFFAGSFWMLTVAAFIILRRPQDSAASTLAGSLVFIAIGNGLSPSGAWTTRWAGLDAFAYILSPFFYQAGLALLATYAASFARPLSRLRRALTALAYAAAAGNALVSATGTIGEWYGLIDTSAWPFTENRQQWLFAVVPYMLALTCALLAVRASRGSERTRILWATAAMSVIYLSSIILVTLAYTDFAGATLETNLRYLPYFIAPAGLTYALLNRRLLDTGFALNRAVVFTAVSLVVVGAFTLAEWALGGWLHHAGNVTNVVVSASLAIALGLSIHPIHARVDRLVDNALFKKRHEAEKALRTFANEAAFITDASVVLERATDVLEKQAGASWVDFALYDGDGSYGGIGENDPVLVTLRASHQCVDLHNFETALRGEYALPMLARGRLVGALAVGPKTSGEPYAPDELQAVGQLAHGVGVALDLLDANPQNVNQRLIDAIAFLERTNQSLSEAVTSLPDAIAEKLRSPAPTNST